MGFKEFVNKIKKRPAEKIQNKPDSFKKEENTIRDIMETVHFYIYKKDFNTAEQIMSRLVKEIIDKVQEADIFQEDSNSICFSFEEFFEELLYAVIYEPKKKLRRADIPFSEVYALYGVVLFDLKRFDEAEMALDKAIRWNPCKAQWIFEKAEIYKAKGDFEHFFELTLKTFDIAYKAEDVARCYRNLGFYFAEKELWSEAMACNLLSLELNPDSDHANAEISYIYQKTKGSVLPPDIEQIKLYSKKYGFPIGASEKVLEIAVSCGNHFLEKKMVDTAKYCFTIAYNSTLDEQLKEMLKPIF